jgi:hypothetical protein
LPLFEKDEKMEAILGQMRKKLTDGANQSWSPALAVEAGIFT